MNKYPMPSRAIPYGEVISYCVDLLPEIREYNPDQIIGVSRSGMPFATFLAQKLNLDLGMYNPRNNGFMLGKPLDISNPKLLFVDENFVSGRTQQQIRNFMDLTYPTVDYRLCCIMLDLYCPDRICLYGKLLDFWATDIACFFKPIDFDKQGIRHRDEV
jgi:hypothetical protein